MRVQYQYVSVYFIVHDQIGGCQSKAVIFARHFLIGATSDNNLALQLVDWQKTCDLPYKCTPGTFMAKICGKFFDLKCANIYCNKKAVLSHGEPHDATVNFDKYWILQRRSAVSLPQHGFLVYISDHSNAEVTLSMLIFTAVTKNRCNSRKLRHTTKILVKATVIVNTWLSYSAHECYNKFCCFSAVALILIWLAGKWKAKQVADWWQWLWYTTTQTVRQRLWSHLTYLRYTNSIIIIIIIIIIIKSRMCRVRQSHIYQLIWIMSSRKCNL